MTVKNIAASLCCLCVLCLSGTASAVDFKAQGLWQFRVVHADRNLQKDNAADKFRSANRLRTQIDAIVSESLSGSLYFTIGHQNWGTAREGAALGTDSNQVRVDRAYIDWQIPNTDMKVRMGLQRVLLPSYFDMNQPILDIDLPGITVTNTFNKYVALTGFWLRPFNDNAAESTGNPSRLYYDNMDLFGLSLPLTFDGVKVNPWGIYGMAGRDSLRYDASKGADPAYAGMALANANLLPVGATGATAGGVSRPYGDIWFAGISTDLTRYDPWRVSLDAAYGSTEFGTSRLNGRDFDVRRSGWYAALRVDYALKGWTPGVIAYYASGDDGDPYNGSERLPALYPDVFMTSYGFDGTWYSGAGQTLGFGLAGTWAVMGRIKDVSFVDKLNHTLRVVYYGGTNSPEMVKKGFVKNLQQTQFSMSYFTTQDSAWEVNLDTTYKLYDNLLLGFELGYIRLNLDQGLWDRVGYRANENNWKVGFSASYMF